MRNFSLHDLLLSGSALVAFSLLPSYMTSINERLFLMSVPRLIMLLEYNKHCLTTRLSTSLHQKHDVEIHVGVPVHAYCLSRDTSISK